MHLGEWVKDKAPRFLRYFSVKQKFFAGLGDFLRVLDLGCGAGNNGFALKRLWPGVHLYGVDILPAQDVPIIYTYRSVDLDSSVLPFPDEYFDAIVFTHVIEHLHSPLKLGKEIHRVAKKGARIYVETPNWTTILVPSFGFHRDQHNPFNFYDDPTHVKPWTQHGLYEFLSQTCGMTVLKLGSTRIWKRIPLDIALILFGLVTGSRKYLVSAFWNLYGWSIYGVGVKE